MRYNIIPSLVTIESDQKKIPWFTFSDSLDFFWFDDGQDNKFTYTYIVDSMLTGPDEYTYEYKVWFAWFLKKTLRYQYKIGPFKFVLKYDIINKIITVNSIMNRNYINYMWLFSPGKILSDIILWDIHMKGYYAFDWCALKKGNDVVVLIWWSRTWKTTRVSNEVEKDWLLISEDLLIIDPLMVVYPVAPKHKFRTLLDKSNRRLWKNLDRKITKPMTWSIVNILNCYWQNKKSDETVLRRHLIYNPYIQLLAWVYPDDYVSYNMIDNSKWKTKQIFLPINI